MACSSQGQPDFLPIENVLFYAYPMRLHVYAHNCSFSSVVAQNILKSTYIRASSNPAAHAEMLCEKDILIEKKSLALRTMQGIDMLDMPVDIPDDLYELIDNRCVLTTRGMLVSNEIFLKILGLLQENPASHKL
jgi:hypothetical protein